MFKWLAGLPDMMNRKTILTIAGLAGAALAIVLAAGCCTFTPRNPAFEDRIAEFARRAEPGSSLALFNGKDLSGWRGYGLGRWTVKNGVVSVRWGLGYLATRCEDFSDFILSLDIRVSPHGNSGVYYRAHDPGFTLRPWPVGFEAQVDNHDPKNMTGSLYNRASVSESPARDGEWFHMEIRAQGARQHILVNGETIVDATDPEFKRGFIALQGHHPACRVDFRDVIIRIPEEDAAP
ncbi:MAG: DUF1080 domain-containing protein [bacterium]|nr:DUF1080 domain-containing protein [bacterium]